MPATATELNLQTPDRLLAILSGHGLSLNQVRVLLAVAHQVTGPTDIAARLAVSPSAVGEIFIHLKRRGLLSKSRRKNDERRITYLLTSKGREIIHQLGRACTP